MSRWTVLFSSVMPASGTRQIDKTFIKGLLTIQDQELFKSHNKRKLSQQYRKNTLLWRFWDNFTMALYSFGGVNDQCGATSWAVQDPTGMLALLSCLCCHGDSDCNKTKFSSLYNTVVVTFFPYLYSCRRS